MFLVITIEYFFTANIKVYFDRTKYNHIFAVNITTQT